MDIVQTSRPDDPRQRRRLTVTVKESLRDLNTQLALLNHQISSHVDLKDVDYDCLEVIQQYGPLSPSALAHRAGVHPATLTGVLDRLERGRWIERERDPSDRRAVRLRALRARNAELFRLFSGMNTSMDDICADYGIAELEVIAAFLRRTASAGRQATEALAAT